VQHARLDGSDAQAASAGTRRRAPVIARNQDRRRRSPAKCPGFVAIEQSNSCKRRRAAREQREMLSAAPRTGRRRSPARHGRCTHPVDHATRRLNGRLLLGGMRRSGPRVREPKCVRNGDRPLNHPLAIPMPTCGVCTRHDPATNRLKIAPHRSSPGEPPPGWRTAGTGLPDFC
jgi:hypothetical protein